MSNNNNTAVSMQRVKDKLGDKEVYIMMLEERVENLQAELQQLKDGQKGLME